jgi:hypothetical protein
MSNRPQRNSNALKRRQAFLAKQTKPEYIINEPETSEAFIAKSRLSNDTSTFDLIMQRYSDDPSKMDDRSLVYLYNLAGNDYNLEACLAAMKAMPGKFEETFARIGVLNIAQEAYKLIPVIFKEEDVAASVRNIEAQGRDPVPKVNWMLESVTLRQSRSAYVVARSLAKTETVARLDEILTKSQQAKFAKVIAESASLHGNSEVATHYLKANSDIQIAPSVVEEVLSKGDSVTYESIKDFVKKEDLLSAASCMACYGVKATKFVIDLGILEDYTELFMSAIEVGHVDTLKFLGDNVTTKPDAALLLSYAKEIEASAEVTKYLSKV